MDPTVVIGLRISVDETTWIRNISAIERLESNRRLILSNLKTKKKYERYDLNEELEGIDVDNKHTHEYVCQ